jgi:hypothetical protein
MKKIDAAKLLRRVRPELARDHEFPNGRKMGAAAAPSCSTGRVG